MKRAVYGWMMILGLFSSLIYSTAWTADVKLKWQPNSDADLAGYYIHYGTASKTYTQKADAGNVSAWTLTGLEANKEYFFALSAYDALKNESTRSAEISGVPGDTQKPALLAVVAVGQSELRLGFSETLEPFAAETIGNYSITPAVMVNKAFLQSDRKTVVLTTAAHTPGVTYQIAVSGVRDIGIPRNTIAANSAKSYTTAAVVDSDNTPPTITLARLTAAAGLSVHFSEPLDATSAIQPGNYHINNGITVLAATLSSEGNVVHLTTSEHNAGVNYVLTVNNVRDRSAQRNSILPNSYYAYSYDPGDTLGPMITLVNASDADQVEVLFNEPLDKNSAETIANYTIQGGITVLAASLDASGQIVRLHTSAHLPNQLYVLNVRNVCDNSARKNVIAGGTAFGYVFVPVDHTGPTITQVVVKDATHITVHFNETVDRRTAENASHYQISDGVAVLAAVLDVAGQKVDIETTPHTAGQLYILRVNEVLDATSVGNEILPNSSYAYVYGSDDFGSGPTIVRVQIKSATQLVVEFSKPLERLSAQKAENYQINRGGTVQTALLDEAATSVTLTTSAHEAGKVYILTINSVRDATVYRRAILNNSSYSYLYEGADTVGPVISLVSVIDAEHLDVMFNERIAKNEAETVSNYVISGTINVKAAKLDGSQRIVHLTTSAHAAQKLYVLRVNGLKDASVEGNLVAPNTSYAYLYEPADAVAPAIAMVRVRDIQHLEVSFNEAVTSASAGLASNYALNKGQVLAVTPGTAAHQVVLEISALQSGQIYVLMVNNIKDLAGNTIAANSAYTFSYGQIAAEPLPAVTSVNVINETELQVAFSMLLDKTSATRVDNYVIQDGVTVKTARLDAAQNVVWLTTTAHAANRLYVLLVSRVGRADRPDLTVAANSPFFYMLQKSAGTAPGVQRVTAAGEMLVEVYFNQKLEQWSAENRRNYQISNDIAVLSAELDEASNKVTLVTSRHKAGLAYTVSISGVRGAESSAALSGVIMAYTFMPSLQVTLGGVAESNMAFLEIGKPYYVDRNYVVTAAPEDLIRTKLIMTANSDKGRSESRFMVVTVSQATVVYVGYDANASAAPTWLSTRFTKTDLKIGVSESSEKMTLWAGYFTAGEVVLGGNNATGARGAKCMYVVLLQEPAFARTLSHGQLEELKEQSALRPVSVALLPNYPNPFNPSTTIRFELPYEKRVRLIIYDILGRQVRVLHDGKANAGVHALTWHSTNEQEIPVAAGIYFYRLEVWEDAQRNGVTYRENYITTTRKMTYIK